ncbi:MAG TPA: DUF4432 family protein [Chloroflexota bacterium]|nr:DUF4432 family protein [Chloroflexota bacterium]
MHLWGRSYTREGLLRRVGRLEQLGGVEATVLDDGPGRGMRALRFSGAGGLACTVLPDRGMDIAELSWRGCPLSWRDSPGPVAPGLAIHDAQGFDRAFLGGMLTTCGLTNFGPGGKEGGEDIFMHGLATYLPAGQVAWGHRWEDDRCLLFARGALRQARLFGDNLSLTREISMDLDGATLTLEDLVRNEGWEPSPHMILYHCNVGFPLLDEGATLRGRFAAVVPRDEDATRGLDHFTRIDGPQAGFREQVFITTPLADEEGYHEVSLWNPALLGGLGLRLRWDAATLPWMFAWRQLGEGAYVQGLEPTNCPVITGRAEARANGTLPFLAPQEERRYRLEFTVVNE